MKLSEKFTYWSLTAVCAVLSLIPLGLLYILSDFLAWLAHSVVKYRLEVVRNNLASAFPEKEEKELRQIERGFYHFLADYFFETIKLFSMSTRYISRHLKVEGIEMINDAVDNGKNVSLFLGHYCNWEWVSSLPLHISKKGNCAQVYHKLHNKGSDLFFYRLRTHFGANNIPMDNIMRVLIGWKREGVPSVTGYIADQAPSLNVHLFVDFLNHDTSVYTGAERISRFLDAEVFYCHMSRPKRGYYTLRFIPVTRDIKNDPVFEPSREYFRLLEQNIREAPQYWLWSHRRWKHTRQQFFERFGDKADEQLSHL